MIEISTDDYRRMATLLRERIGVAEWFNGSVALPPPVSVATSAQPAAADDGGGVHNVARGGEREDVTDPEEARTEWRLTLTAIVYRRDEELPEGTRRPIADVVPVWWEFSTDDRPNDFSFAELRPFLIDYE